MSPGEPSAADIAAMLRQAVALHQQGALDEAAILYRSILTSAPRHFDALHLLGFLQYQKERHELALTLIDRAISLNPNVAAAHSNRGLVLQALARSGEALAGYDRALQLRPDNTEALSNRGSALLDLNRPAEALDSLDRALSLQPDMASALMNRGNALRQLARAEEALVCYDRALLIDPHDAAIFNNRGNALLDLKRPGEALACYDRALQIRPDYAQARNNRGSALLGLKRYDEALAACDEALRATPDFAEAYNFRGIALSCLRQGGEALASIDRALQIKPDFFEAHNNRGTALLELKRPGEALVSYDRALQIKPDYAEALNNRANALDDLKRHNEAAATYARLLAVKPDSDYALGFMLHARIQICDWSHYYPTKLRIISDVERGEKRDPPFSFLAHSQSAAAQLVCARNYVADKYPASAAPVWMGERYAHEKIRIAYLSADFHNHATAYLMAGLFEAHDKEKFEVSGISFGPGDTGGMRQRLQRSFHRFVDARQTSDRDIARLLRELEIDIAIDLKGFTKDCRPGIFAHRGAPVQASYLGYPGTMGADYIDYILADSRVIPPGGERFYAEKVVRLPDTYQVNDRKRRIAERTPSRSELGLPDDGFVFCCFNNNYKITPFVFDIWMRLLKRVDGSVLWLLQDNADASRNLIREAESRGVAANRLVFAPRLDLPDHLARHRCADLFLDTLPCNAHTTASDALWAGLPLLTCMGETFASRVAGSLLHAACLPELATRNLSDYEALAYKLATVPNILDDIKARLARTRDTCPLFDTDRFRRHIEAAYAAMHERHQRGEPPASFDVTPMDM